MWKDVEMSLPSAIGAFIALAGSWFGGWDTMMILLLTAATLDWGTGVLAACSQGRYDPRIGLQGITKKLGVLVAIILCAQIDNAVSLDGSLRTLAIAFYTGNEGMSIIENLTMLGVPVPDKLKYTLELWRNKEEKTLTDRTKSATMEVAHKFLDRQNLPESTKVALGVMIDESTPGLVDKVMEKTKE